MLDNIDITFNIFKKKNSPYYFVRFYNSKTHKYFLSKSTKETDIKKANAKIKKWLKYGIDEQKTTKTNKQQDIKSVLVSDIIANIDIMTFDTAKTLYNALSTKLGSNLDTFEYIKNFYTQDSEYYHTKKIKGYTVTNTSLINAQCRINRLKKIFSGIPLNQLNNDIIQDFLTYIDNLQLATASKNLILGDVKQVLKYAFDNELIIKDLSKKIIMYKNQTKEKNILTKEMLLALVTRGKWTNEQVKYCVMLSACTGLRMGEIRALQLKDIGNDRIYVNHSFSDIDGLKLPKNNHTRTVLCPFTQLLNKLVDFATKENNNIYNFVFTSSDSKIPITYRTIVYSLHNALLSIGLNEQDAKKYTFHSLRHFYTAYMKNKVSDDLLQSQTGHLNHDMLLHYASHETQENDNLILKATEKAFLDVMPKLI